MPLISALARNVPTLQRHCNGYAKSIGKSKKSNFCKIPILWPRPRLPLFDSRMLRSNVCESLWLLECGVSVGQSNNGK
jgi:hypothetical protein